MPQKTARRKAEKPVTATTSDDLNVESERDRILETSGYPCSVYFAIRNLAVHIASSMSESILIGAGDPNYFVFTGTLNASSEDSGRIQVRKNKSGGINHVLIFALEKDKGTSTNPSHATGLMSSNYNSPISKILGKIVKTAGKFATCIYHVASDTGATNTHSVDFLHTEELHSLLTRRFSFHDFVAVFCYASTCVKCRIVALQFPFDGTFGKALVEELIYIPDSEAMQLTAKGLALYLRQFEPQKEQWLNCPQRVEMVAVEGEEPGAGGDTEDDVDK